ncbi:alpha/beta hydrolase [Clostridium sp. DJ247]|uniref:alpha/beta hydrolase n=1 Tax=Clostridium sp. DJ247 TaxID=2726188 RepID=UPI001629028C|nr:alpha/beta hydrolase [Clostridium sp. DJ247]MBC2581510.1 alpha/beta hydrolase [Clostridium sp. DJ247]
MYEVPAVIIRIKVIKKSFVVFLTLFVISFNACGFYIANMIYSEACRQQTSKGIPNLHQIYRNTFDDKRFSKLSKEEVEITSLFGYKLSGTYIPNPIKTNNTVVIVHGFRGSRWESMKYADLYIDKGFNTLIYDSRYSGESGGNDVTFGFYEKYDLDKWIDWVYNKNKGGIIGVHGESMGASTLLLHSQLNEKSKRVKFYVADCPYSDLKALFIYRLEEDYHIKNKLIGNILTFYTNIIANIRSGFAFSGASPINAIKDVRTPIMFIHGDSDKYIPFSMSEEMYSLKNGPKDIYIAPYSGHAQAYLYNKKVYKEKLYNFIDKYIKLK